MEADRRPHRRGRVDGDLAVETARRWPAGRRAALAALALSGLRSQEVAGLRLRHLDFTHGRIVIADGKTHGSIREVHMSPFLRDELLRYIEELKLTGPDDLLFATKRGRRARDRTSTAACWRRPSRALLRRGQRAKTRCCHPRSRRTRCAGRS